MKYFISDFYGCVYWLENDDLWCAPQTGAGTFDTNEGGLVERPHNEVPESYYKMVIKELS